MFSESDMNTRPPSACSGSAIVEDSTMVLSGTNDWN